MLFSLGGTIVINCISATKYYICSSKSNSTEFQYERELICSQIGLKYINIAIILMGASCVMFFLSFFFKLVNVFNYTHSVPSAHAAQHSRLSS